MRKVIFCTFAALLCSSHSLFAQSIDLPADRIATLLCKNWELDHAIMGGMKIEHMPGATTMNYEFHKDKTFVMTSNDAKNKTKGTWSYDPKKN